MSGASENRSNSGASKPLTYSDAGVNIAAGEEAVERIKAHVRSTFRPEVIGDLGGFGGLFSLGKLGFEDPVLVASTDGVGTKSMVARLAGKYDTIGIDLVAMSADDIAVQGAEPLFFLTTSRLEVLTPTWLMQSWQVLQRAADRLVALSLAEKCLNTPTLCPLASLT